MIWLCVNRVQSSSVLAADLRRWSVEGDARAAQGAAAGSGGELSARRVVLSAWHEIDNALTQYSTQQTRHDQLEATVKDDQIALRLARAQYTARIGSFLQVLDAERRLLAAQQDLTDNITQISTTLVSLYKALGGGWEATYPDAQL